MLAEIAARASSAHWRRIALASNRGFFFLRQPCEPPSGNTRPTVSREFAPGPKEWGQGMRLVQQARVDLATT